MTERDMEQYIRVINSNKPELIHGYAGSLQELSKFAIKNHLHLHSPNYIISSAETLRDEMRLDIEEAFGTKVFNFYGSREVSNLAGECTMGLMHMFDFWNYLEVLDENNQPVKVGEEGKVVVTNLFNYSMPLIRYEIGDLAIRGPDQCTCGNILPTLKTVVGRMSDPFILEDGTIISGGFITQLFYFKNWVHSFQIIQEDYKKIKIVLVLQDVINPQEQSTIEENIRLVMGNDCAIFWEIVEEIPKTSSGKHLYRISYVWRKLYNKQ
jgi:phenylacetate-CoA ligase